MVADRLSAPFEGFSPDTLKFLADLAENNNRPWFEANRSRYEEQLVTPALCLIEALRPRLMALSPHYPAVAKKTGGSLMRIYRDLRFSQDRRPYKTNVAIHIQHRLARKTTSPGFYMSFDSGGVFFGVGCWRPPQKALRKIRQAIDQNRQEWLQARDAKAFRTTFHLGGESLTRAPKGYSPGHPLIEDLQRKDVVGFCERGSEEILDAAFADRATEVFAAAEGFMRFLCRALGVPF